MPVFHDETFGFDIPTECANVPIEIMKPRNTWSDGNEYDKAALKLANMFHKNFKQYEKGSSEKIIQAGPKSS